MPASARLRSALIAAGALLLAAPALADAIDGEWCSPDGTRAVTISGPRIVTGGVETTGDYTRHTFSYTVPDGAPEAGTPIDMRQLNEEEVLVREGVSDPVIWRRCKPVA